MNINDKDFLVLAELIHVLKKAEKKLETLGALGKIFIEHAARFDLIDEDAQKALAERYDPDSDLEVHIIEEPEENDVDDEEDE